MTSCFGFIGQGLNIWSRFGLVPLRLCPGNKHTTPGTSRQFEFHYYRPDGETSFWFAEAARILLAIPVRDIKVFRKKKQSVWGG